MNAPHSHLLVGESNAPPFLTKPSSAARTALLALLVILVSYLAARLGGKMVVSSLGLSVFWPPSALLVAAMLLVPRRNWLVLVPAGLAGAAIENLQLGYTLGATGLFFLANTIEFVIIGLGLGYSFDGVPQLNSSKAHQMPEALRVKLRSTSHRRSCLLALPKRDTNLADVTRN
ncbi:MAG: MASE1 domain-containing protein [Candidatus Acidiferrum sp.]